MYRLLVGYMSSVCVFLADVWRVDETADVHLQDIDALLVLVGILR